MKKDNSTFFAAARAAFTQNPRDSRYIGAGLYPTADKLEFNPTDPAGWLWSATPPTLCCANVSGTPVFGAPSDFATMNPETGKWSPKPGVVAIYSLYARRPAAHPLSMVPGPL